MHAKKMFGVSATLGGDQACVFLKRQVQDIQIFNSIKGNQATNIHLEIHLGLKAE